MASANWMKATTQKAGAMKKHLGKKEREQGNHSNKDIDQSLSKNNYTLGCVDYGEALERMKARTKEVDELIPPKRIRKDRVTCCFIELPCPGELTERGISDDFFKGAYKTLSDFFGAENVHGGFVHKDEVHTYTDKGKAVRTSLEHVHVLVSAYTHEKGINGKAFETRARLRALNNNLDEMCFKSFGVHLNTGETPEHKSVERLKEETMLRAEADSLRSDIAELTKQKERCLDNYLSSIPPVELEEMPSMPEEPKAPQKNYYQSSKQEDKKYNKAMRDYEKAHKAWEKKLLPAWELECEEVKARNAAAQADWDSKYQTADNLAKAQKQIAPSLSRARQLQQQALCDSEKAATERKRAEEERHKAESERKKQAESYQNAVQQGVRCELDRLFNGMPTSREERLEAFCEGLKFKDGTTALERFEEQEQELQERYGHTFRRR